MWEEEEVKDYSLCGESLEGHTTKQPAEIHSHIPAKLLCTVAQNTPTAFKCQLLFPPLKTSGKRAKEEKVRC